MLDFDDITLKIAKNYPGQPVLLMTVYAVGCRRAHNPVALSFKVAAKLLKLPDFHEGGCQALSGVASRISLTIPAPRFDGLEHVEANSRRQAAQSIVVDLTDQGVDR